MALEQDILLAISVKNDSILKLHNLDSTFKDFECDLRDFKYVYFYTKNIDKQQNMIKTF